LPGRSRDLDHFLSSQQLERGFKKPEFQSGD
jgi:hypothetical protein